MLHGHQSASTAKGGADADFQRNLFVGSPGRVYFIVIDYIFQDFGGGCAWIGASDKASSLVGATGNGFVAG